jgi:hypothetical protein
MSLRGLRWTGIVTALVSLCHRPCPRAYAKPPPSTMRLTLTMRGARVDAQNFADANLLEAALRQTTTVAREEDADDVITATRGRLGLAL